MVRLASRVRIESLNASIPQSSASCFPEMGSERIDLILDPSRVFHSGVDSILLDTPVDPRHHGIL